MNSSLYYCRIEHFRARPKAHRFALNHFMFFLDLDEVDKREAFNFLFSDSKLMPYCFNETDYLHFPAAGSTIRERLSAFLESKGLEGRLGKVFLLANVRIFGYVFNPVSFFFCMDKAGGSHCCVIEVSNTFAEKKLFLLNERKDDAFLGLEAKNFYVSPFTEPDQFFRFQIGEPSDSLSIFIDTLDRQDENLSGSGQSQDCNIEVAACLRGRRRKLSSFQLICLSFLCPLATLKTIFLIHFHALLLFLKGVPHHEKNYKAESQTELFKQKRRIAQERAS